jgi:hypothetical protein
VGAADGGEDGAGEGVAWVVGGVGDAEEVVLFGGGGAFWVGEVWGKGGEGVCFLGASGGD